MTETLKSQDHGALTDAELRELMEETSTRRPSIAVVRRSAGFALRNAIWLVALVALGIAALLGLGYVFAAVDVIPSDDLVRLVAGFVYLKVWVVTSALALSADARGSARLADAFALLRRSSVTLTGVIAFSGVLLFLVGSIHLLLVLVALPVLAFVPLVAMQEQQEILGSFRLGVRRLLQSGPLALVALIWVLLGALVAGFVWELPGAVLSVFPAGESLNRILTRLFAAFVNVVVLQLPTFAYRQKRRDADASEQDVE